jgi:hypothetical protein
MNIRYAVICSFPGTHNIDASKAKVKAGNTKRGRITVLLTSCLTGLESVVWQLTIFVFICKTD